MDDLEKRFKEEFAALCADKQIIPVHATALDLWAVLSMLQLAARHPGMQNSPTRKIAESFARQIQERVAATGALAEVAAQGWNPAFDVDA